MLARYKVRHVLQRGVFDVKAAASWLHSHLHVSACTAAPSESGGPSASGSTNLERLFGVALLERLPIIVPDPPKWQSDYEDAK
jgi:hypothetical protein